MKFNRNFYQSNNSATREMAENRLMKKGYKNFQFNSVSRTNGASFYFTGENGEELRVSDHPLTGSRAFNVIQIDLYEKKEHLSPIALRRKYIQNEITKKEYKKMCNDNGFIYRP